MILDLKEGRLYDSGKQRGKTNTGNSNDYDLDPGFDFDNDNKAIKINNEVLSLLSLAITTETSVKKTNTKIIKYLDITSKGYNDV